MKTIEGNLKEIVLDENETIIVSTMKKNKIKIYISAKDGALHVDNVPISKIEQMRIEEESIKSMKEYIKERSKK